MRQAHELMAERGDSRRIEGEGRGGRRGGFSGKPRKRGADHSAALARLASRGDRPRRVHGPVLPQTRHREEGRRTMGRPLPARAHVRARVRSRRLPAPAAARARNHKATGAMRFPITLDLLTCCRVVRAARRAGFGISSTASSPAAAVVVPMEHARAKGPAGLHEVRTAADRRSGSPDPKGSPSGAL